MRAKLLGHRGGSLQAPENTIIAVKKALEADIGGVELDVHLSKDGHLIVCHDEMVDRTTNGKGLIKDLTLEEIKKLDAGSWFDQNFKEERIPTLEEILKLVTGTNFVLNVELKSGLIVYPQIEEKLVELLEEYNYIDKTIVSSFNHHSLVDVYKLNSDIKIGILYYESLVEPWEYASKLKAFSLHPFYLSANEEVIKNSSENGIKVIPFPVNDKNIALSFINWGAEYIITDDLYII